MVDAASGILTAFGLSASAGLNAYLPLMVVALLARFTKLVTLKPPYDGLTNGWVMLVIGVLLAIELFADRVAVLDTANDVVQTFIRPAAGAILFAASSSVISDVHPVLALICGLLVAGAAGVAGGYILRDQGYEIQSPVKKDGAATSSKG